MSVEAVCKNNTMLELEKVDLPFYMTHDMDDIGVAIMFIEKFNP